MILLVSVDLKIRRSHSCYFERFLFKVFLWLSTKFEATNQYAD